jgi:hypothetical protein
MARVRQRLNSTAGPRGSPDNRVAANRPSRGAAFRTVTQVAPFGIVVAFDGERTMQRHLLTAAILLAALVLYGPGFSGLGAIAVGAGAALELWFWVRILRRKPPSAVAGSGAK